MNPPLGPVPFREITRREQRAVYKELCRPPGDFRKLNFRIHVAQIVLFFPVLFFVFLPLSKAVGTPVYLAVLFASIIVIDELIWRLVQVPAAEKELRGRSPSGLLAEAAARDAAEHQPEKW